MSVLRDVLVLLTAPPGGMVYYLVVLFSIWATMGLALSRWFRGERKDITPRLLIASTMLSLGYLAFFVLALVDRTSSLGTTSLLIQLGPPLERFLGALSAIMICWAVAIRSRDRVFSRVFLGIALPLAAGTYVVSAVAWAQVLSILPDASYNLSWQNWAWEAGQLALLLGMMVYTLATAVPERGTVLVLLLVLAGAHLFQAASPAAETIPYFAGWVRLANLIAFPLFAMIAYRRVIAGFDAQSASLQSVNRETLTQITGLMDLLDTHLEVSDSLDLDMILRTAVRSVSQTVQADLCAVVLLDPEDEALATLPVLYQVPDTVHKEEELYVVDYPALEHALSRGKALVLTSDENDQARQVYRLMDSQGDGPLIVQPLVHDARTAGFLLVARPGQEAPFTEIQVRKCETLARYTALAVANAREYQRMRTEIETHKSDAHVLERELSRTRAGLENRLREAKDEIAVYVQRLYETEQALQHARDDVHALHEQLKEAGQAVAQEQEDGTTGETAAEEAQDPEIALLTKRLATSETARSQLERQVKRLEQEHKQLRSQLAKAEATYNNLRTRLREQAAQVSEPVPGLDVLPLHALPSGIVVCDARGQILNMNPAAAHMLGTREEEWQGQNAASLWPDEQWQSAIHRVTDGYTPQGALLQPLTVQRPAQHLQILLSPLLVSEEHAGAVLAFHEVPETDARSRARDEFLSSLSQELRTPMTSIVGYTELLMNESVGKLDDTQRRFLQRVQANIERMGALLNDLLGVTAIESGRLDIELEPVNVERAFERALQNARFRLAERELNAHLEIGEVEPIYLDPDCFQQIVDNLLNNASKSSETGTTIHIIAHEERDETGNAHLHFSVSDTGGGIAPQDHGRVFERFYRADSALISGLGETGVGLAIVKALVEAHGGHVWMDTEIGQGTTFHVALPYGLERTMDTEGSSATAFASPPPGASGRG
ncbi:MAG: ATP-binding protein [Anaerolineae bacterium]|jgi:signal transduction histidine kinase/predicted  nucleic acid-binding Zn-ribbon protein